MLIIDLLSLIPVVLIGVLDWLRGREPKWKYHSRIPFLVICLIFAAGIVQALVAVQNDFERKASSVKEEHLQQEARGLREQVETLNGKLDNLQSNVLSQYVQLAVRMQNSEQALSGKVVGSAHFSVREIARFRDEVLRDQASLISDFGRGALARNLTGFSVKFLCNGIEPCQVASAVQGIINKHNPSIPIEILPLGAETPEYAKPWLSGDSRIESNSIIYRYDLGETQAAVAALASLVVEERPQLKFDYLPTLKELPHDKTLYIVTVSSDRVLERPVPIN
jgi:hypothetical protein